MLAKKASGDALVYTQEPPPVEQEYTRATCDATSPVWQLSLPSQLVTSRGTTHLPEARQMRTASVGWLSKRRSSPLARNRGSISRDLERSSFLFGAWVQATSASHTPEPPPSYSRGVYTSRRRYPPSNLMLGHDHLRHLSSLKHTVADGQ